MSAGMLDPVHEFVVYNGDMRIVAFCCDVVLYFSADVTSIPDAVLHVYEKFLSICPPGIPKWYSTENMTRDKPCTPRALNMLRDWLKPGAPPRQVVNIQLSDGPRFDDAGEFGFWVYGEEPTNPSHGLFSNVIRCSFPGSWAIDEPEALKAFALDACKHFPFQSGHAGFVLEIDEYAPVASHIAAWRLSMQHPGLDIANPITDSLALRREAIKGVNWLTILGDDFAKRLGGEAALRRALPPSVDLIQVQGGLVLQAGPQPRWGHVNRNDRVPDYQAVYDVVEPLQAPILDHYTAFSLPGGQHRAQTRAWLRRFARGGQP